MLVIGTEMTSTAEYTFRDDVFAQSLLLILEKFQPESRRFAVASGHVKLRGKLNVLGEAHAARKLRYLNK